MFAHFPGHDRWDLDLFICIPTQSLLAIADVIHAHYLCSILHQLSEDHWGSPSSRNVGDVPCVPNRVSARLQNAWFPRFCICNAVLSQQLPSDDSTGPLECRPHPVRWYLKKQTATTERVPVRRDGLLRVYVARTGRAGAAAWKCCLVTHPDPVHIGGST